MKDLFFGRANPLLARKDLSLLSFRVNEFNLERDNEVEGKSERTNSIEMPFDVFTEFTFDIKHHTDLVRLTYVTKFGCERILSIGLKALRKILDFDFILFSFIAPVNGNQGIFDEGSRRFRFRDSKTRCRNIRCVKGHLPCLALPTLDRCGNGDRTRFFER